MPNFIKKKICRYLCFEKKLMIVWDFLDTGVGTR
jgi:hypothetical protein